MTALGISLIVSGLILVGASIVFLMFTGREPSYSQETFEESLERMEHHLRDAQRTPRALEDKSAPTEHIPNDR